MDSVFHRKYDRTLRTAADKLTAVDLHIALTLQWVLKEGQEEEARQRLRGISSFVEFTQPFKSSKASAGKLTELYPVARPQVLPEDHRVLFREPTKGEHEDAEVTGALVQPEHQVSELLSYFHEVEQLLRGIRPVGSESMEPEYREGF